MPQFYSGTLADPIEQERRRAMLSEPHISSLAAFASGLRRAEYYVPDFDPCDGGVDADILFLFEKPGPKTAPPSGSGFISRDNDDPTAEATKCFMEQAGIDRARSVIWNVIPGWNQTISIKREELRDGFAKLDLLLPKLINLKTIVLVGRKAQSAAPVLAPYGFRIVCSYHPSRRVKHSMRDRWEAIPYEWAKAKTP